MNDCRDDITDYPVLPQSDEDAEERYRKTKNCDPFPEISASLLNAADIYDYVRMTGMLDPFDPDPNRLKGASYEACIGGECIYWDDDGKKHELILGPNNPNFILGANSIAFVQVEPYFRLPDYIAVRFNLKIRHVHRGILLGTGPLVDPGYEGKLLVPLHNLTTNEYTFKTGESLIWIEFTKTSQSVLWDATTSDEEGRFSRLGSLKDREIFPTRKAKLTPSEALAKASPHQPIRSSIPDALETAKEAAETSRKEAKKAKNYTVAGLVVIVIGMLGAAATVVVGGADILTQLNTRIHTTSEFSANVQSEVRELRGEVNERIKVLERDGSKVTNVIKGINQAETDKMKAKLSSLLDRIAKLEKELERLAVKSEKASK